jgi:hypothetical protein
MNLSLRSVTAPAVDNEFLASSKNIVTRGVTIDAAKVRTGQYVASRKILKAGTPLGKITATGLRGPVKKTTLKTAASATDTSVTLVDPQFFQVGDTIIVGTEASAIAIDALDYTTGVATLHSGLTGNQAKDVTIKVNNGLETATGLLLESIDLTDGNAAVAGVTQGVVTSARIPGYNALIAADLTRIEFR